MKIVKIHSKIVFWYSKMRMHWYLYCTDWHRICSVLELLQHQNNLKNLIQWARRKKLTGVRKHYEFLAFDIVCKLSSYSLQNRRLLIIAEWLHCARNLFFSQRFCS